MSNKGSLKGFVTLAATFLVCFLYLNKLDLHAQHTFPELVSRALGSDQELINGIQFSNHYAGVEGHPYFLDGIFRPGSVRVGGRWYEQVMIRYNLYSQKVEIEYRTVEGNRNQIMSVAEKIPSFYLDGIVFVRMQFPGEAPAYYQQVRSGNMAGYIGWRKTMEPNHIGGVGKFEFTPSTRKYWLQLDQQVVSFHNRRSFLAIFPGEQKKEIARLLKETGFSFSETTASMADEMIRATLSTYEPGNVP